jgi:hypothetical protein
MTLQIEKRSGQLDLEISRALFRSYPYIRGPIKGTGQDGYPDVQKIEQALATFIDKDIRAYLRQIHATYSGGDRESTSPLEDNTFLCLRARVVDDGQQRLQPDTWYLYSLTTVDEALVTIEENWQLLLSRCNGLAVGFPDSQSPTYGSCKVRFFSPDEISAKMEE